ncbi:MAG TPA: phosphoribosylformylglycinamidine synthase I, partial [Anaerolineaceae bacterium]|nr:phosphoribosylformylglycinamidine synthase I [Anaerolineaceae bacterium]
FEALFNGLPFSMLGMVQTAKSLTVRQSAENLFTLDIERLVQAWKPAAPVSTRQQKNVAVENYLSFPSPSSRLRGGNSNSHPKALILQANGTNRDPDVALALELAGAAPEIVPLNLLRQGNHRWQDYQMLVLAGGFSYADALGAGKLLALDLQAYFADEVNAFVESGKPVLGICNGFQALVKAGILPGGQVPATLTFNRGGHFECRWVRLLPISQNCVWTRGLEEGIECPVAHGEGNFQLADPAALATLRLGDQIALAYAGENASPAGSAYPANPNGSLADIAGVCNPRGNVLGLMPHPENHIFPHQHPQWTRRPPTGSGLRLFQNAVKTLS